MVTEYMSGGELADRLYRKDKRPSWDLRIKWLEDVSAGLMYLHYTHRSVHRDVKSGNILLTDHSENARAKLGGMFFFFKISFPSQQQQQQQHRLWTGESCTLWQKAISNYKGTLEFNV